MDSAYIKALLSPPLLIFEPLMQSAVDYKIKYEAIEVQYEQLQVQHDAIKAELYQLKRMIFGSKHERFVPSGDHPSQLT